MSATLLDALLGILSVIAAPFVVQGVRTAKSRTGRIVQIIFGCLLVGVFVSVWGATGKDPIQLGYCAAFRAAPACDDITWGPSNKASVVELAGGLGKTADRASGPVGEPLDDFRYEPSITVADYLTRLDLETSFHITPFLAAEIDEPSVRATVVRANDLLPAARSMLAAAVADARRGHIAAGRARRAPDSRLVHSDGLTYRGELDSQNLPSGFGQRGQTLDPPGIIAGRFKAISSGRPEDFYLETDGPTVAIARAVRPGAVFVAGHMKNDHAWMKTSTVSVWGYADGRACVASIPIRNAENVRGVAVCRIPGVGTYAGEVIAVIHDVLKMEDCPLISAFCYSIRMQGLGSLKLLEGRSLDGVFDNDRFQHSVGYRPTRENCPPEPTAGDRFHRTKPPSLSYAEVRRISCTPASILELANLHRTGRGA